MAQFGPDPVEASPAGAAKPAPVARLRGAHQRLWKAVIFVATIGSVGGGLVGLLTTIQFVNRQVARQQPDEATKLPAAPERPAAYSAQDRRQSVIVLPFENSSGDPGQDMTAASMTRDVSDMVAGDKDRPLVPSSAAQAYRGATVNLREIGRAHDVHFAVTGSVRQQNDRIVVSVAVYDTVDSRPVWSRRFDRPDTPGERAAIVWWINDGIYQATVDTEAERAMRDHPASLDKRDLMLAASATPLQQISKDHLQTKLNLIERALALDPHYLYALQQEARIRALIVGNGFSADVDADLRAATAAADRALLIEPNNAESLRGKATVLRVRGDLAGAEALLRRVIEIRPMWGYRYFDLGTILLAQGHFAEALEDIQTAKRLALPNDAISFIDAYLAVALLANDRLPEAIVQARLAIAEFPPESGRGAETPWLALIAAQYLNGQREDARADLRKFLSAPRSWGTIAAVKGVPAFAGIPKLTDGLSGAGMPAE